MFSLFLNQCEAVETMRSALYAGVLPAGDVPAVCQPEAVLPQQMARLP